MLNDSMVLDYMGKYEHFIHFKYIFTDDLYSINVFQHDLIWNFISSLIKKCKSANKTILLSRSEKEKYTGKNYIFRRFLSNIREKK